MSPAAALPAARRPPIGPTLAHGAKRLVLTPPEGVPVSFALASIGTRAMAQIVDLVLVGVLTVTLFLALFTARIVPWEGQVALLSLFSLLFGTPIFVLSELLWNGRTPGKRMFGIRVLARGGQGLSTHQVVVRNLLREVEVLLPLRLTPLLFAGQLLPGLLGLGWGLVVLAIAARGAMRQRLGDLAADTIVVHEPRALLLPDLAAAPVPERTDPEGRNEARFAFTTAQLELYGAYELQVLERLLHDKRTPMTQEAMVDVARAIRRKIGHSEDVPPDATRAFLLDFYRDQRAFLEQKKLFGEARDDKFHREAAPGSGGRQREDDPS